MLSETAVQNYNASRKKMDTETVSPPTYMETGGFQK